MEQKYDHAVLIVDDEEQTGKAIARLLKKTGLKFVYAPDGETGLSKIENSPNPFSIIISAQRMPGMKGNEFLEKASKINPDTVRFLITGHSNMDVIIDAVNRGAIHRYIAKPWDDGEFMGAVQNGIEQYELILENERLFKLAKEQNQKLYKFNQDLKEKTDGHRKILHDLDREIEELKKKINTKEDPKSKQVKALERVEQSLKENHLLDQEKFNTFFVDTVKDLFEQFQDVAARNGFEMPGKI